VGECKYKRVTFVNVKSQTRSAEGFLFAKPRELVIIGGVFLSVPMNHLFFETTCRFIEQEQLDSKFKA
jgi:hypothetical protein